MQVKITTGERKKSGFFGGGGNEIFLKCEIVLTPEERVVLPQSGMPITALTTSYRELDEYDNDFDGIKVERALAPGGAEHVVRNIGQVREKELECVANCRQMQRHLENLKGYEIEKSYTLDLEEELAKET